jgi:hypothetical protein
MSRLPDDKPEFFNRLITQDKQLQDIVSNVAKTA